MLDVVAAQGIEHEPTKGHTPEDTVTIYWASNKLRHFANVHTLRLNIKHRWDSLKATGSALDFDTTFHPRKHMTSDSTAASSTN